MRGITHAKYPAPACLPSSSLSEILTRVSRRLLLQFACSSKRPRKPPVVQIILATVDVKPDQCTSCYLVDLPVGTRRKRALALGFPSPQASDLGIGSFLEIWIPSVPSVCLRSRTTLVLSPDGIILKPGLSTHTGHGHRIHRGSCSHRTTEECLPTLAANLKRLFGTISAVRPLAASCLQNTSRPGTSDRVLPFVPFALLCQRPPLTCPDRLVQPTDTGYSANHDRLMWTCGTALHLPICYPRRVI